MIALLMYFGIVGSHRIFYNSLALRPLMHVNHTFLRLLLIVLRAPNL